jgi:DNA-binding GntR family transcriptional regulator
MAKHLAAHGAGGPATAAIAPATGPAAPIETTSLADEIAFRLEAAILAHELLPGTKLGQEELCQRFGVSRTPVREALRKLQAQRLVVLVPNKGATVRLPTRTEVEEIYDLRAELEAYAAELACRNAGRETDAELARMAEAVKARRGGRRGRPISDSRFNLELAGAIRDFHQVIYEAAGNQRLAAMLRELFAAFPGNYCSHGMTRTPEGEQLHLDDHERIREAIHRRDPEAARRLMKEHTQRAKQMLLRHFDERGLWPAP